METPMLPTGAGGAVATVRERRSSDDPECLCASSCILSNTACMSCVNSAGSCGGAMSCGWP